MPLPETRYYDKRLRCAGKVESTAWHNLTAQPHAQETGDYHFAQAGFSLGYELLLVLYLGRGILILMVFNENEFSSNVCYQPTTGFSSGTTRQTKS